LPGETASGHWVYAFLRYDATSGQRFLVVANLHREIILRDVQVHLPAEALGFLRLSAQDRPKPLERLSSSSLAPNVTPDGDRCMVVEFPALHPLTPCYVELQLKSSSPA
jgi:hypothetical protein